MTNKLQCRFCRRKLAPTKYVRHACNNKKKARAYYEEWRNEHRDDRITTNKYPTFEAWDIGILDGALVYPIYPYAPPSLSTPNDGIEDVGDSDDSGETIEGDNTGVVLEQGTEWTTQDDKPKSMYADGSTFITKPSDQDKESETEKKGTSLKDTAEGLISKGAEVIDVIKISTKEKGWLPIIAGVHEGIMWAFKGKERNSYFKLNRNQKKILTASYQATFGDSPLLKLKTQGQGEYDVHIVVANIEVYGEFIMANIEGGMDRGQGVWNKWQEKAKKKKELLNVETTQ